METTDQAEAGAELGNPLSAQAFAAVFNHLLQQQPWAQARLARHGGKTIRVNLLPLLLRLSIDATGMAAPAPGEGETDATLGVSPLAALYMLTAQPLPQELVHTAGDAPFAVDFGNILRGLRWDAEEDLSKVFGDVLAHRLAGLMGRLFALQKRAGEHLVANFTEYWTEEKPLLAKPAGVGRFVAEVDRLRDDVERLEKRIARLQGLEPR